MHADEGKFLELFLAMIIFKMTSTASHQMQNQELGMVDMFVILLLDRWKAGGSSLAI